MKFVWLSNSVATKKGNKVGTIELAHSSNPFFAAYRLVLENITRHIVNMINRNGKISCFNFNI